MAPNPCNDWHDWERFPEDHDPFHYWLWDASVESQSEERLGQRVYISSCLLWSALHDRYVGGCLLDKYPNWSAICNYYSMVHALRLFWFVLYGSYPTGHAEMGDSFDPNTRHARARATWCQEGMRGGVRGRGRPAITFAAFKQLLEDELQQPTLAARLGDVGDVFLAAKELRTDSNYESLILAHQYHHILRDRRNVHLRFMDATEAFRRASTVTITFVCDCLKRAFDEEVNWIGRGSRFDGSELYRLMLRYVRDKIKKAHDGFERKDRESARSVRSHRLFDLDVQIDPIDYWWSELGLEFDGRAAQDVAGLGNAGGLVKYAQLPRFQIKGQFMSTFSAKVERLQDAVRRMAGNDGSPTRS